MKNTIFIAYILISVLWISDWNYNNFQVLNNQNNVAIEYKTTSLSNQIYNISIQHIQIWKWLNININDKSWLENSTMSVLNELKYFSEIDIIMLIDLSRDKNKVLEDYLTESNITIEKSDFFIYDLQSQINDSRAKFEECSKEKISSDKEYFSAIEDQNVEIMNSSINISKKADICMSTNRIDINSKQVLLDKITYLRTILIDKNTFLEKNQNVIVDNFSIIRDNLAEQLYQITKTLTQY